MNSTNIWKKISNTKSRNHFNGIVDSSNFKSKKKKKKKKFCSNLLNKSLITNWENENQWSIDENIHKKDDEDSLQLDNLQHLATMNNLIFLDLENFSTFFEHLRENLPEQSYVIAFQSSNFQWKPPKQFEEKFLSLKGLLIFVVFFFSEIIYENLLNSNNFHLMQASENRHDGADFALVLTVKFCPWKFILNVFSVLKLVG